MLSVAEARVGGGQDYSSSSSSSSYSSESSYSSGSSYSTDSSSSDSSSSYDSSSYSSDSDSSGDDLIGSLLVFLIEIFIRFVVAYPQLGVPLILAGVAYYYYRHRQRRKWIEEYRQMQAWSQERAGKPAQPASLERLEAVDANFSQPLFLDFISALYSRLYRHERPSVRAFLSGKLWSKLDLTEPYQRVVMGSLKVKRVELSDFMSELTLEVEANLFSQDGQRFYVVESLQLWRAGGVLSREPEKVYAMSCPSCGAPAEVDAQGHCAACAQKVDTGRFDWQLSDVVRLRSSPAPSISPAAGLEPGTELPTVYDLALEQVKAEICTADPDFSTESLKELAADTFLRLQQAWTSQQWDKARPLETDNLFGEHQLWMDAYRRQGLRNVLEDVQVTAVDLAKLHQDRFYESATLRLFASMKDYTVRVQDSQVYSGSATTPRRFSEYWTFVRRRGVTTSARSPEGCPHCGAPLDKISMAGECEYCSTVITRGDFGWVLSRIEQDEAYF